MDTLQEERIILGIDPGTTVTGYGLIAVRHGRCHPLDFGCIRPPAKLPLPDRYFILFQGVEELLQKYKPQSLAVETQFVYKNVQSAFKVGMARGVVIVAAKKWGAGVYEYAPRQAKAAVTSNGGASKQQVQSMVKLLLNLPIGSIPEDAADALALAICHAHTL